MRLVNRIFISLVALSFSACAGSETIDFVGCEWKLVGGFKETTDSPLLKSYARFHADGKMQVAAFYFDKDYPVESFSDGPAKDVKSTRTDRYRINSYSLEDEFSGETSRIVDFVAGSNYVQLTNVGYEDALSISNRCVEEEALKAVY